MAGRASDAALADRLLQAERGRSKPVPPRITHCRNSRTFPPAKRCGAREPRRCPRQSRRSRAFPSTRDRRAGRTRQRAPRDNCRSQQRGPPATEPNTRRTKPFSRAEFRSDRRHYKMESRPDAYARTCSRTAAQTTARETGRAPRRYSAPARRTREPSAIAGRHRATPEHRARTQLPHTMRRRGAAFPPRHQGRTRATPGPTSPTPSGTLGQGQPRSPRRVSVSAPAQAASSALTKGNRILARRRSAG
ncbi:hypothetical protein A4R44_04862 [Amycolatopsis sp. M39]|nr:hypothetical protein A4R44_04862 [Amycolatopsis sp. M39]